ncbi:MAG TPA: type II toxin-antitoxin system VapC family toxin [Nocardioides sp.]|uniref:type II toxin-antitoxin system VapC family toxin n=1 Tax=uncultured Nocardioides sp. TaxID=198441 RepID=UPI000EDB4D3A|nr:type II toxin-antitoxin system VapC family toxin [uncultured Nocardioides sp.]HCB03700.1 VapC toxin family PIN domain ribonuclease [Nocardioides sp.]HRD60392.1 type II toxin-antitoxin system VapC family toxin [Nocardioides sp.]HRI94844.1 type II toxin-antitoxin system VapC family toxin [Nocardioides sp.]HRK45632.1 type II toxin-antitoxin system VapC family toxin [Nocardioides sp.]
MIVDASAVVAIIQSEPDATDLLALMRAADVLHMATPTALELTIALGRDQVERTRNILAEMGIRLVDFTTEQQEVAQHAFARYGRGSGSKARLNFGDCIVYALAKVMDEPLLFKGDDFTHTDITPAITRG